MHERAQPDGYCHAERFQERTTRVSGVARRVREGLRTTGSHDGRGSLLGERAESPAFGIQGEAPLA
jgi:hypothetical protein